MMLKQEKIKPAPYYGSLPLAVPEEILRELADMFCPDEAQGEEKAATDWPERGKTHCAPKQIRSSPRATPKRAGRRGRFAAHP